MGANIDGKTLRNNIYSSKHKWKKKKLLTEQEINYVKIINLLRQKRFFFSKNYIFTN